MTFEEYWHKRTVDHADMVWGLWVSRGQVSNAFFHVLKNFAEEVWKVAQTNKQINQTT